MFFLTEDKSPSACRPSATLWQKQIPTFSANAIFPRLWKCIFRELFKSRQHILRQRGSPRCSHVRALIGDGWPHKHTSKHSQRIKLVGRAGADLLWTALTMWKTNMKKSTAAMNKDRNTDGMYKSGGGAGVHCWHFTSTVNFLACVISVLYACWTGVIGFSKTESPKS